MRPGAWKALPFLTVWSAGRFSGAVVELEQATTEKAATNPKKRVFPQNRLISNLPYPSCRGGQGRMRGNNSDSVRASIMISLMRATTSGYSDTTLEVSPRSPSRSYNSNSPSDAMR